MLDRLPDIPDDCSWATFVRNHDELTLDQLTEEERADVFAAFGPEPRMQLYGRGLRRRLPSMLDGDPRRLRLVYSLLFSLRTPMQWTEGPTAGFSTASPDRLCRPLPDGAFGPDEVNVAAQRRDPDSLLNWMERVIRRHRETPELGWGAYELLDAGDPAVLATRSTWEGRSVVAVHNLAAARRDVCIAADGGEGGVEAVDLLDDGGAALAVGERGLPLSLEPWAHRWYRLRRPDEPRLP